MFAQQILGIQPESNADERSGYRVSKKEQSRVAGQQFRMTLF